MLKIGNIKIGLNRTPKIIAEISANHNQSLGKAIELIKKASKSGADFVKIQTYSPECLTLDSERKDFIINDPKSPWHKKKLFDLYKIGETPYEWHKEIFNVAKKNKIILFASVFDEASVDFLEKFNPPAYKVASFESNHYPLIKKIIKTRKPILISTGLNTLSEINSLVKFLKKNKCEKYALLKCTSSYPANLKDLNIKTIIDMKNKFNCEIGYSDHSIGYIAANSAIHYGASFVEKHICLDNEKGIDSKFSLKVSKLKEFKDQLLESYMSIGKIRYGATKNEKPYLKFRRSIYCSSNILKGEKFTKNNIKIIRPGLGIEPKYFEKILGKFAKMNLKFATALKWKYIKN
jgi:pseudaminic acid synthase